MNFFFMGNNSVGSSGHAFGLLGFQKAVYQAFQSTKRQQHILECYIRAVLWNPLTSRGYTEFWV